MSTLVFAVAAAVWLVAAYAFVRVALAWFRLTTMAPAGEHLSTALALGFWRFDEVERRLGPASSALVRAYRGGALLFFGCIGAFMVLVIINIVGGTAA